MAKDKNDPQDEMVRLQQQIAAREVDEELQREKISLCHFWRYHWRIVCYNWRRIISNVEN